MAEQDLGSWLTMLEIWTKSVTLALNLGASLREEKKRVKRNNTMYKYKVNQFLMNARKTVKHFEVFTGY